MDKAKWLIDAKKDDETKRFIDAKRDETKRFPDGNHLAARRKKAKLTRKQLAEKLGVSPITVGRWEKGTRSISRPTAQLINLVLPEKPTKIETQPEQKASWVRPEELKALGVSSNTERRVVEALGSEMIGDEIREGDLLIIDLEGRPEAGDYVFLEDVTRAVGRSYVRKYQKEGKVVSYLPISKKQADNITPNNTDRYLIRGLVRMLRKSA